MYKAGDFTNGKMNEIFKKATLNEIGKRYDDGKDCLLVTISHKQYGEFALVSRESMAVKAINLYCVITGIDPHAFFVLHGDGTDESDKSQLDAMHRFLFPCVDTEYERMGWGDVFFAMSNRLMAIVDATGRDMCAKYMEAYNNG